MGLSPRGRGNRGPPKTAPQPARVYPRVGGGTGPSQDGTAAGAGLSPRGRGNLQQPVLKLLEQRSIPAWAGEPAKAPTPMLVPWVYPRVGGGTGPSQDGTAAGAGLSPRGRGNLQQPVLKLLEQRSIPAWGGGTGPSQDGTAAGAGLSPRGRGNLQQPVLKLLEQRSIPAWAGEPAKAPTPMLVPWVYPRVGGGTGPSQDGTAAGAGLSPRGRGNRIYPVCIPVKDGSIPAWAGEPLRLRLPRKPLPVYPRVGGGTFADVCRQLGYKGLSPRGRGRTYATHFGRYRPAGLSPRGRGNLEPGRLHLHARRSIPAWAGEPCGERTYTITNWVYPRVGGGTVTSRRKE